MSRALLIVCGGGVGALLRYLAVGWGQQLTVSVFPLGTFLVNVVGCFFIGALGVILSSEMPMREELRLALVVGLLGGFTTFSSFGWETFALAGDGEWRHAALYVVSSNLVGLLAVWLGYRLAETCLGVVD